jgi:hypothetical protein
MAYSLGEIRALTGEEIAWMQTTMQAVDDRVAAEESAIFWSTVNPINYALGTQRDAMTRAQNLLAKDKSNAGQLRDSLNAVIEAGDTDRLQKWFDLANTIIDPGAVAVFNQQIAYASTAETAKAVAQGTAHDLTTPTAWPWWLWAAGGLVVLSILSPYVTRRK